MWWRPGRRRPRLARGSASLNLFGRSFPYRFRAPGSRTTVRGAIERRESAAQRLITALGWFWTVYTASSLLGTAPAKESFEGWEAMLVLSPIATLSAAYLAALWALNPIAARVAQTESQAIDLWERVLARKLWRIRLASGLLIFSTVLIVAGVPVVATRH